MHDICMTSVCVCAYVHMSIHQGVRTHVCLDACMTSCLSVVHRDVGPSQVCRCFCAKSLCKDINYDCEMLTIFNGKIEYKIICHYLLLMCDVCLSNFFTNRMLLPRIK